MCGDASGFNIHIRNPTTATRIFFNKKLSFWVSSQFLTDLP